MFGLFEKMQEQLVLELDHSPHYRRLYVEGSPADEPFCPFCAKAERAYFKLLERYKIPPENQLEIIDVSVNAQAEQELLSILFNSIPNFDIKDFGYPVLIYNRIFKMGCVDEGGYYLALRKFIIGR